MDNRLCFLLTVMTLTTMAGAARAADNDAIISNAMSAAPEAVGKNATIMSFDDQGQMITLREGTNNFTCIPDDPTTPSNDPMCVDDNGMAWLDAFVSKTAPPEGKVGFGYMLQGETAASNVDPFAAPPADGKWSEAGPHVMIFNAKGAMVGYPRPDEDPDMTQPFIMWKDTPYEHLMIPVSGK